MTYALAGNLWSIVFTDANGDALNTAYSIYTDDLEQDYDILYFKSGTKSKSLIMDDIQRGEVLYERT